MNQYVCGPLLALALLLGLHHVTQAQTTPGVGIGTTAPNASAALDISATGKGLLIPRMDSAARAGIATPPDGLMVFQTDGRKGFWYAMSGAWLFIPDKARAGDNLGNHTATQALNLQGQALTGTGASISSVGVGIRADGGLNLGQHNSGQNIFMGYQAGVGVSTGFGNLFVGQYSGEQTTDGIYNQFTGLYSGRTNRTGSYNVFTGPMSGRYSKGSRNTFTGFGAGYENNPSDDNTFTGAYSGYEARNNALTPMNNNVFTGSRSGYWSEVSNSVLEGYESGYNARGTNNVFEGYRSGYYISGDHNTYVGYQSGHGHTGLQSGFVGSTNNTALGANAGPVSSGLSNATALGANAQVSQSNSLVLGSGVNVGIGTPAPSHRLHVDGVVRSSTGGFMFPDGSVQTTSATGITDTDTDNQTLNLSGRQLTISKSGSQVTLPNDLQTLSLSGRELAISKVGGTGSSVLLPADNDNQVLDLQGNYLTLTGGNISSSVNLPNAPTDNLGNHSATQNLVLNQNSLYLTNASGFYHQLRYNSTPDGPQLFGYGGGELGYNQGTYAPVLRWTSGGNVGIGTTSPSQKLEVAGQVYSSTGGFRFPDNTVQTTAATGGSDNLGNHTATQKVVLNQQPLYLTGAADPYHQLRFSSTPDGPQLFGYNGGELGYSTGTYAPVLRWTSSGRVGIGTTSPEFPLDVQGSVTPANFTYGYLNGNGNTGLASNTTGPVSIRAAGRIVATEFNATSDRRLKTVIGLSDNVTDLGLLTKIRITDYTMRDRVQYGQQQFKKVIAQEVEQVYPQAVSQHTGFLPDVYAAATRVETVGDSLLRLTLPAAVAGAKAGQRVKLIGPKSEVVGTVTQAPTGNTLLVRGAKELVGQPVFVFGLEHPDVRTVDYEALSMLHVSATQELARKVQALEQQNAAARADMQALKARAAAAETKAAQATATLETFEARLRALEASSGQARK